jgi:hypothetical protein
MKKVLVAVVLAAVMVSGAGAQTRDRRFSEQHYTRNVDPRMDADFYAERKKMREAVQHMGFSDEDNKAMMRHVIDNGGRMTADSLRESEMTYEAWEQFRDDARYEQ